MSVAQVLVRPRGFAWKSQYEAPIIRADQRAVCPEAVKENALRYPIIEPFENRLSIRLRVDGSARNPGAPRAFGAGQ